MTVCAGAIQPSQGFHFNQLLYISELFKYRTIDYVDNTRFKFNLDSFFLPSKLFSLSILLLLVV